MSSEKFTKLKIIANKVVVDYKSDSRTVKETFL